MKTVYEIIEKTQVNDEFEVHIVKIDESYRVWAYDSEFGQYLHNLTHYPTYKCNSIELARKTVLEMANNAISEVIL